MTSKRMWPLRLALLVAWLAIGAFGGMAQGQLSGIQKNDQAQFLPASAQSTRAAQEVRAFNTQQVIPLIVTAVPSDGGKVTPEQFAAVRTAVEGLPDTVKLPSTIDFKALIKGRVLVMPAPEFTGLLGIVNLDSAGANERVEEGAVLKVLVTQVREALADDPALAGMQVNVTGPAGFVADLSVAFGGVELTLLLVALAVVLAILVAVYRSPILPIAVLASSVFALSGAALAVYHLAKAGIIDLSGQSQGILSILVVGATTDYALLLVARYREELSRHPLPAQAMSAALRGTWEPITASAATVIAGLMSLLLADLTSLSSLGPIVALGITFSYLCALTLLPGILLVAGKHSRALFWPSRVDYHPEETTPEPTGGALAGNTAVTAGNTKGVGEAELARHGLWLRVANFVCHRPRAVWITSAVVLIALGAFLPTFRFSGVSQTDIFLTPVDSVAGQKALEKHFPAGAVQPVNIITAQKKAPEVLAAVQALDGVNGAAIKTDGPPGPPPGMMGKENPGTATKQGPPPGVTGKGGPPPGVAEGKNAVENKPLVVDGKVLITATTSTSADDIATTETVREIRDAIAPLDPEALVGGAAAERLDTNETGTADTWKVIPVSIIVILLMLIALLRSIVAPLIIMAANLISFASAIGISAILFNHVFGFAGADAAQLLYGFVFLVSLGIDYTIFLMSRVREESLIHGTREGIRRGVTLTGGVITSAGLVLAATFAVLAVVPLLFLFQLAVIVSIGVLLDTFVVRSLLVPAFAHRVGRPIWLPWANKIPADSKE